VKDQQIKALDKRLGDFVTHVTADMGRSERRQWAEVYLRGLLLDGERKSIEPMALRVGGDVQGVQQFVGQSPWAEEKVMEALNKHMASAVAEGTYWIIDETTFPSALGGKLPGGWAPRASKHPVLHVWRSVRQSAAKAMRPEPDGLSLL